MKKVLILGGTTYDSIVYLKELPQPTSQTLFAPHHETMGSTGAGKALAMTKLKMACTLHSIFGDDRYGLQIKKSLTDAGVDFVYDIDPAGTERHINLMSEAGERISIFISGSSSDLTLDLKRIEQLIIESDLIVLNIIGYTKQLIPLIKKHHKPVWTDLHDYDGENPYHQPFIDVADVIFLSSDQLTDYKAQMQTFIEMGKSLVVCTHGVGGATALSSNEDFKDIPIITNYPFVDANGAGDNFFSGFLYGYLQGCDTLTCLQYATIVGGLAITSKELSSNALCKERLFAEHALHYAGVKDE